MPGSKDKYINAQVKYWHQQKDKIKRIEKKSQRHFITISREYGCSGYSIGKEIVELINSEKKEEPLWAAYDRQVLDKVMTDMGLSSSLAKTLSEKAKNSMRDILQTSFSKFPPQIAVYRKLVETIRLLAINGNVVIIGRAGNVVTIGIEGGYNVRIIASMDYKIKSVQRFKELNRKKAKELIIENTSIRENYIKKYVKFDVTDPNNYDIVINLSKNSIKETARLIVEGMKIRGFL